MKERWDYRDRDEEYYRDKDRKHEEKKKDYMDRDEEYNTIGTEKDL